MSIATKLKYLKAYFTRDILPAQDAVIGEILYTDKNIIGRRKQYVIDVDAKLMAVTTIDSYPADPTTKPGAILSSINIAPLTDTSLYILGGASMKTIIVVGESVTKTQAEGAAGFADAIASVFANDRINGEIVSNLNTRFSVVSKSDELTVNGATGAVSIESLTIPGTYFVNYKITDIYEPTNFKTGIATVIVDIATHR